MIAETIGLQDMGTTKYTKGQSDCMQYAVDAISNTLVQKHKHQLNCTSCLAGGPADCGYSLDRVTEATKSH